MPELLGSFQYTWPYYLGAVLGYLLGAIPFGLVLTRLAGLGDIRKIGSGNIGATNVMRTGHKGLAAATFLLDAGKGVLAAFLAGWLWGSDAGLVAAFFSVLGHDFPVWLSFRGGKGVATSVGVTLLVTQPAGLAAIATWMIAFVFWRISSLSALCALVMLPIYALAFHLSWPQIAL